VPLELYRDFIQAETAFLLHNRESGQAVPQFRRPPEDFVGSRLEPPFPDLGVENLSGLNGGESVTGVDATTALRVSRNAITAFASGNALILRSPVFFTSRLMTIRYVIFFATTR
jgi:hypothetical protein